MTPASPNVLLTMMIATAFLIGSAPSAVANEANPEKPDDEGPLAVSPTEEFERFLRDAALEEPEGPIPDLITKVPDPAELKFKEPATFSADQGIYFDPKEGVLVFLTNVEANHPQFTLKGADELKVFLEPGEKKEGEIRELEVGGNGKLFSDASFGDPSKIVATGVIVVEKIRKKPGEKNAKASGRRIEFDFKSNELIISGGKPWVISDSTSGTAVDPDGFIRINVKSGDASINGDAEFFQSQNPKKP